MVERLVGGWTWFSMICKELLSALSAVYGFINNMPRGESVAAWPSAAQELRACAAHAVFIPVDLDLPWSTTCFMTSTGHGEPAMMPVTEGKKSAWDRTGPRAP